MASEFFPIIQRLFKPRQEFAQPILCPTGVVATVAHGKKLQTNVNTPLVGCFVTCFMYPQYAVVGHFGPGDNNTHWEKLQNETRKPPEKLVIYRLNDQDYNNKTRSVLPVSDTLESYRQSEDDLIAKLRQRFPNTPVEKRTYDFMSQVTVDYTTSEATVSAKQIPQSADVPRLKVPV